MITPYGGNKTGQHWRFKKYKKDSSSKTSKPYGERKIHQLLQEKTHQICIVLCVYARIGPRVGTASLTSLTRSKAMLRKMYPHIALLVKIELQKLLYVDFIKPIDYEEWISNLVPVTKHSGHIWICTNFRDLNKACSKDDFSLLNTDMIVDLTTGNEMLSLMDGFSRL